MIKTKIPFFVFILSLLFVPQLLNAQSKTNLIQIEVKNLPEIPELKSSNPVFSQYCDDVSISYKEFIKTETSFPTFYSYKVKTDETLLQIASRCNITYDTIATLNSISNVDESLKDKTLVLPTAIGLFILDNGHIKYEEPLNSIETLLQKKSMEEKNILCYNLNNRIFCYYAGERFSQTERAFFLDVTMKMPLDHYYLSSSYGKRHDPFTGTWQFHKGIDMAAPIGTEVFACKGGTVVQTVYNNKTYGNYIVIQHSSGMRSFYAHLSKISVKENQIVQSGKVIGYVGQSGAVTGPHLHFEVRVNGQAKDPEAFLPN